ncbi:MAG TPA: hypothetical protein VHK67_06680, partial [Rhabdochlamydiaceae bacterium]|nr:hypothetical protein [Rhabdochlamydiaceae bacterium]
TLSDSDQKVADQMRQFQKGAENSTLISSIPADSPFADTDLVLVSDDYSSLLSSNGIQVGELRQAEELFKQIQEGKTALEIDRTDPDFFQQTLKDIKKLLTRKLGRKLIIKVCQRPKKVMIVKSAWVTTHNNTVPFEKTSPSYHDKEEKIIHNPNLRYMLVGMTSSGKRTLYLLPSYLILGHECIHASDPEKGTIRLHRKSSMGKVFSNEEEQYVIIGLLKDLSSPSDEEGWEPWIQDDYQELNERNLTAAFADPSFPFYPRYGHNDQGGIKLADNEELSEQAVYNVRATAHPFMQNKIASLKKTLSQMKDLPAPVSFIIDCYFWINTLKDQPSSSKTLEAIVSSLKIAKEIDIQKLDQALIAYNDLKQWGDWKIENIDQLFKDFFHSCKQKALSEVIETIPAISKAVFERIFQPYIDKFNQSTLILPMDRKSIEEELWNDLIQEKNPVQNISDDDVFAPLQLEECESLLRLLFVKRAEQETTKKLILSLVKKTRYYSDPINFPMNFLRTMGKNNSLTQQSDDLQNRLVKFFEPVLINVLSKFLVDLIPECSQEQGTLFSRLFDDLLHQPVLLIQEFRVKGHSYAQIVLNYLDKNHEKISSLSLDEKEIVFQLTQKLKSKS